MKLKHFDDESLDDLYRSNNGYFLFESGSNQHNDEEEFKGAEYDFLYKAAPFPDDIINNAETDAEQEEETD